MSPIRAPGPTRAIRRSGTDAGDPPVRVHEHLGHQRGLEQQAAVGGHVRAMARRLDRERQPVRAGGDDGGPHVGAGDRLGDHGRPLVERAAPGGPRRVVRLVAGQVDRPAERLVEVALDGHAT
jgi:hypothetical protein